ncbi:MAG: DNA helicase II, partial [Betaproteobacteria bacterium]
GSGLGSMVGAGRVQSGGSAAMGGSLATRSAQGPTGTDGRPLRVGQGVFHNKFGEGVIVTLEGSGTDARAQVNFGRHGMKWLALSVAKLTPVD